MKKFIVILALLLALLCIVTALGAITYPLPTVGGSTNTWGTEINEYLQYGQGWVDVRGYDTFELAITGISTDDVTLFIPTSITVAASTTVPENVTLRFGRGGLLSPANGITVTIEGDIQAGVHTIFAGAGNVVLFELADTPDTVGLACGHVEAAWFGAFETDIGLSITKAIAALSPTFGGTIRMPVGEYDATTVIDCTYAEAASTLRKNVKFTGSSRGAGSGSRINIAHTGIGFDCVGSKYITFDGFTITGDSVTVPNIGILFARPATPVVSVGITNFNDMNMWGEYTTAAIYNYGAEIDTYVGCRIQNDSAGAGSAIYLTKDNNLDVQSTLKTIKIDDTEYSSSQGLRAFGCTFVSAGDTSKTIYLRGVDDVYIYGSFFICGTTADNGNSNIFIEDTAASTPIRGLHVDSSRFEVSQQSAYCVHITGGTVISEFNFRNNFMDCQVKVFYDTDTKISGGTIWGNIDQSAVGSTLYQIDFMDINMGNDSLTVSDLTARSNIWARGDKLTLTGISDCVFYERLNGGVIADGDVARTATTGGGTTGLIDAFTAFVTITSDNADKQITLPAPVVGKRITLVTPAIGCELICTGSSVKINDVICSATNEAALVADSHYIATCISATEWILVGYDKLGAHVAPIVPDSL